MNKKKSLPPTYFNISLILIFISHYFINILKFIYFPVTLIGIIPIITGCYLNLSADKNFKKYNTTVKPYEESSCLIKIGVFKFSRNPMYLGMFLILVGISILLGSIIPFIISVFYAFMINCIFISTEEKMLSEKFGDEWTEYKLNVRRWI